MHSKTTEKYYFIPTRMAINKKKKGKTSVNEEIEKLEPSYIASWVVKWYSYYGRMELT